MSPSLIPVAYQSALNELFQRASDKKGYLIINDAKTPSGRVHVGSLRGVVIHDAVAKIARDAGHSATFLYDLDDMDPMDGLPADAPAWLKNELGKPLCDVRAPDGNGDMANYYAGEFLGVMDEIGADYELVKARDLYKEGRYNLAIDKILHASDKVRLIYKQVSGSEREKSWLPIQVICEKCGKLGSTKPLAYTNGEVHYVCQSGVNKWADGCGYEGKVSPFDGRAKLPWKVEWAAKWEILGVDFEGAGKDHSTKGGSRDVANAIAREVLNFEPPVGFPYEFFLIGGAKMSSSKGLGVSAREMADLLPPDVLRFLILRTPPKRTVNFDPGKEAIIKLFNDFDRLTGQMHGQTADKEQQALWCISKTENSTLSPMPSFALLLALCNLPHFSLEEVLQNRGLLAKDERTQKALQQRIHAVRHWMEHFAIPDDLWVMQDSLPEISELTVAQKVYLRKLTNLLAENPTGDEEFYQSLFFEAARETPIPPNEGFSAFYKAVFDRPSGPKGGGLAAYLGVDSLVELLSNVETDEHTFVKSIAEDAQTIAHTYQKKGFGAPVSLEVIDESGVVRLRFPDKNGKLWVAYGKAGVTLESVKALMQSGA